MGWFLWVAAIVPEVVGTILSKQANGFRNLPASALMVICYCLSLSGLTFAMKTIDMSIAYSVWTGCSILAIAILDFSIYHETMSFAKGLSTVLLVTGLVGLSMEHQPRA